MSNSTRIEFLEDPKEYFFSIRKAYSVSWSQIARELNVRSRTLTSWRLREATMPLEISERWRRECSAILPNHLVINLDEKRTEAGSLGGRARHILYGNLGTPAGRRRGGLQSWQTHKKNPLSPFVARPVTPPRHSVDFAELVGAILGDGTVTTYQLILYSNIFDESEYSAFLSKLILKVFRITAATHERRKAGVIRLVCSRAEVVIHLQKAGVGIGNKVRRQAEVPLWIKSNIVFAKACLRGLIDTDGCVYLDHHHIKGQSYVSLCIAFTNASIPLLDFVFETWRHLGFHPTRHGRHVRLRRRSEVLRYVNEVGFSNPKHMRKIQV